MRSAIILALFSASLVSAQSAQGTATVTTPAPVQTVVELFLGAKRQGNYSFTGSVVSVQVTATTYEPWTVTEGPSLMIGVLSTAIANVTAILGETCTIDGLTAAYCNYTFSGISDSQTTFTSYSTVITGGNYVAYPVTITAGAEKLAATSTSASTSGAGAAGIRIGMRAADAIVVAAMVFNI